MSLWGLIPAAANFAFAAYNKPKKIKMNDKYLNSYIANLRGDKISGDVRQKALEAESKVIGAKTGRAMRNIQSMEADPQQKTQAIVDLYSKENEALGGASDRASRLQEQRDSQISQSQRGIEEYIAKTKTQIEMQNDLQQDQYKKNIVGAGINLAASGAAAFGQQAQEAKALEAGKQQDLTFIESLGMKPEDVTPENITSMLDAGTITVDQAKTLITRTTPTEKPASTVTRFEGGMKNTYNVMNDGSETIKNSVELQTTDDTKIYSTKEEQVFNQDTNSFETESVSRNKAGIIVKTSESTRELKPTEAPTISPTQQRVVERAKADLQITANEIDRVKTNISEIVEDASLEEINKVSKLNRSIIELQDLIRSDAPVSDEQFQQMIDTLKKASVNLPQTLKEQFLIDEGYNPEASIERFQDIWTNKVSKELSKNLAATGRLTEVLDEFGEYEVK